MSRGCIVGVRVPISASFHPASASKYSCTHGVFGLSAQMRHKFCDFHRVSKSDEIMGDIFS